MRHPFMAAVATGLAARGIATLRYQFTYMEAGSRRSDSPRLAVATAAELKVWRTCYLVAGPELQHFPCARFEWPMIFRKIIEMGGNVRDLHCRNTGQGRKYGP
jgi:predicted alpha/beta-hydrolase family hydrolase